MQLSDHQIKLFHQIAREFGLIIREPHCSKNKQYFQIYPAKAPASEGAAGTHYEFVVRGEHINLEMHLEKNTRDKKVLKNHLRKIYTTPNTKALFREEVTYFNDETVREKFALIYEKYEDEINKFYEFHNNEISLVDQLAGKYQNTMIASISLNQILFGPPGTGKTYNTINRALEIIDGEVPKDREDAKKRFEELKNAGQIEFVTFHQSYGYEEFVEGLKASSEDGNISYSVEDGIFKSLSKTAMKSSNFEEVYHKFIEDLSDEELILYTASQHNRFKVSVNSNGNLSLFTGEKLQQNGTLTKERIGKYIYNENPDGYWQGYYKAVVKHLEIEYSLTIEDNKEKNYILIIDEINRGNISKIFGELITLIEPSKRLGNPEALEVQLSYSHEKFGVPKNLYIIGTMNTADRSIALLDTALRRRFEFVEMMPESKLLDFKVEGVDIAQLLEKINARVEYLYDRDHTIGHAYFMELNSASSLDDLNAVMGNKIIPLLQEYFYDDWEKILLVLGDGFVENKTLSTSDIFGKDAVVDEYAQDDKILYNIKDNFTNEAYKQLIKGVSNDNIES